MSKTLTVKLRITGVKETLRALNKLPKEASSQLRDRSMELAQALAVKAQTAARADRAPQSRLLAPTIRASRDRVPVVVAGGTRNVGSRKAPAYKVLFGSEFGSNEYDQFQRPHAGKQGYWFFPLVESESPMISREWEQAADEIVTKFSRGR